MDLTLLLTGIGVVVAIVIGGWQIHLARKQLGPTSRDSRSRTLAAQSIETDGVNLFPAGCGDTGIDLTKQRLLLSTAFGTYFTSLLEQPPGYVNLAGQIDCVRPAGQAGLEPVQRIYWSLQNPKGAKTVVIAAEGGMGKSTLAAKIVRCLYKEDGIDLILGDSAKTQKVDVVRGSVSDIDSTIYDVGSFYMRLCAQLSIPFRDDGKGNRWALEAIKNRLDRRRATIVVDNLDTVSQGDELLSSLRSLANRDIRIIVTTRTVADIEVSDAGILVVKLKPLSNFHDARSFMLWHIDTYASGQPELSNLRDGVSDEKQNQLLLSRTGGNPLLVQLLLSDIARKKSWKQLGELPDFHGRDLLRFLYDRLWQELGALGDDGQAARRVLQWIADEQYKGDRVTAKRLAAWCANDGQVINVSLALRMLYERFLINNSDLTLGNYSVQPAVIEFLQGQIT